MIMSAAGPHGQSQDNPTGRDDMARHLLTSAGNARQGRPGARRTFAALGLVVAVMPALAGAATAPPVEGSDRSIHYPLRLAIPAGSEIWLCDYGRVLTGSVTVAWDGATLLMDGRSVCPAPGADTTAQEAPEFTAFVTWCTSEHERVQSGEVSQAAWLDQVRERMQSGPYDGILAVEKGIEVGDGSAVVYLRVADGVARPYIILLDGSRDFQGSADAPAREQADAFVRDVGDYLRLEPDAPHLIVVRNCGLDVQAFGMRAEMMINQLAEAKRRGAATTRGLVPEDILSAMLRVEGH
jgi:hypothetical protein